MLNKQYILHIITVIILIVMSSVSAQSQEKSPLGLDNNLYNGRYYSYYLPRSVDGDQFLNSKGFTKGMLWKKGTYYENILLNYDVLNQNLLLSFKTRENADRIISISLANVDSFYLENKKFVIDTNILKYGRIYQLISYKDVRLYFYYSKDLELRSKLNEIEYQFSKLQKEIYYYNETSYIEIKNNRKLLKLLKPEIQPSVKHYMKQNKYKMKRMSDKQFLDLLVFIKDKAVE